MHGPLKRLDVHNFLRIHETSHMTQKSLKLDFFLFASQFLLPLQHKNLITNSTLAPSPNWKLPKQLSIFHKTKTFLPKQIIYVKKFSFNFFWTNKIKNPTQNYCHLALYSQFKSHRNIIIFCKCHIFLYSGYNLGFMEIHIFITSKKVFWSVKK